jgi:hypothetical protein
MAHTGDVATGAFGVIVKGVANVELVDLLTVCLVPCHLPCLRFTNPRPSLRVKREGRSSLRTRSARHYALWSQCSVQMAALRNGLPMQLDAMDSVGGSRLLQGCVRERYVPGSDAQD